MPTRGAFTETKQPATATAGTKQAQIERTTQSKLPSKLQQENHQNRTALNLNQKQH